MRRLLLLLESIEKLYVLVETLAEEAIYKDLSFL
jgi:hypothetical protein